MALADYLKSDDYAKTSPLVKAYLLDFCTFQLQQARVMLIGPINRQGRTSGIFSKDDIALQVALAPDVRSNRPSIIGYDAVVDGIRTYARKIQPSSLEEFVINTSDKLVRFRRDDIARFPSSVYGVYESLCHEYCGKAQGQALPCGASCSALSNLLPFGDARRRLPLLSLLGITKRETERHKSQKSLEFMRDFDELKRIVYEGFKPKGHSVPNPAGQKT